MHGRSGRAWHVAPGAATRGHRGAALTGGKAMLAVAVDGTRGAPAGSGRLDGSGAAAWETARLAGP